MTKAATRISRSLGARWPLFSPPTTPRLTLGAPRGDPARRRRRHHPDRRRQPRRHGRVARRARHLHTSATTATAATAATRRPATPRRWSAAPTSSSCCTPTTSTRPGWSRAMACMIASGELRRRAGLAHPRQGRAGRRHAALQVRLQPRADARPERPHGPEAVRVPHRLPRLDRAVLERLPLLACSDDFVFDNQMLAQAVYFGFRIGEVSCPTKYFPEASSHQLPPQRDLRPRRAAHLGPVPGRSAWASSARPCSPRAGARCLSAHRHLGAVPETWREAHPANGGGPSARSSHRGRAAHRSELSVKRRVG